MGIFGSVSGKQVDEFAKELARELSERWPPDAFGRAEKKYSSDRLASSLDNVFNKAVGYKNQHKLGIYKKARLGNAFRWELEALGYDKAFIEDVTQRLVVYVARKDTVPLKGQTVRS
jgi:hypothetical protein